MLKTKSRTVPIRLLCFMVTLLALALPARADWSIKVGDKVYPCTKTSGGDTGNQKWRTPYISLNQWDSFILVHTSGSNETLFGRNDAANISISKDENNKYGGLVKKDNFSNTTAIYWESGKSDVRFCFDFYEGDPNAVPYNFYVEKYNAPQSLYLIGDKVNNESWNPNNGIEIAGSAGVFKKEKVTFGDSGDGKCYFSFISVKSSDWNNTVNKNIRVYPASNTTVTVGNSYEFEAKAQGTENNWNVIAGTYDVTVDFNTNKITLTNHQDTPEPSAAPKFTLHYQHKDENTWNDADFTLTTQNGNLYTYTVTVPFKQWSAFQLVCDNGNKYGAYSNSDKDMGVGEPDYGTLKLADTEYQAANNMFYWKEAGENNVTITITYDASNNTNTPRVKKLEISTNYEIAPGYPRVYLLGDLLNNNQATQQYEMILNEATGKYELKNFALRNSWARDYNGNSQNNGFKVRYCYNAHQYKDVPFKDDAHSVMFDWMKQEQGNPGYPGWACDAAFTPVLNADNMVTDGSLEFSAANGESDIKKADVLPYLGILGANFVQETRYETTLTHVSDKVGNTDLGWQEAYIVYDGGQPLVVNGKAVYNTIWPPRENIHMQYKSQGALPLNISTSVLTFRPTLDKDGKPVVKTATQWETDLKLEDDYAYSGLTFEGTGMMVPGQKYVRYVCPNMWMSGDFKVWTGWGGQAASWGAQWNNHFFLSPTEDSDGNKNVVAGKTYKCHGNHHKSYNFNIASRGFFSSVEIFIPVNDDGSITQDGQVDRTRMYLTNSLISAKIDATKNGTPDEGYYKPTVTLPTGWQIDSYKVVRCDYRVNPESTNKNDWQPVDVNYNETDEAGATVVSGNGDDFFSKFNSDSWTLDHKLAEGTYFYYLELNCSNASGEKKPVVVPSPYIDVIAADYTTNVRLYQLVKDTKAGADKYVTYSPTIHKVYNVTVKNGEVSNIAERTDFFDYNSADAQWTAMVACATNLPSKFATSTAAAKQIDKYEITYNGQKVADLKALADVNVAASHYGDTYVGIKNFDTLDGFTSDWKAEFTATLTDSKGNSQTVVATPDPSAFALTMPVYSVDEVAFIVNEGITNGDTDHVVKVNDAKAASHLHEVSDALLNSLDVKISVKNPNVVPELRTALNGQFNDVLTVGDKTYNVTYDAATANKSVTLVDEDPNNWLNAADWAPVAKSVSLKGAGANRFSNADLLAYTAGNASVKAELVATPLQLPNVKIPALRTKVKKDANVNMLWERIYIKKTAMPLGSTTRSMLANVTLNNNGAEELVLLKVGDETRLNNYVTVEDEMERTKVDNGGKCYHRFGELEDEGNLVLLKESEISSTWYAGIYNDEWIGSDKLPTVTFGVANIFSGNTHAEGNGITVAARSAAPALAAADAPTHYVLYPPMSEGNVEFDIQTAVDSIEADQAWVEAGNGFFTINADGVTVYDVNGIKVADAQGRYDVNAGVYLALKAGKAIKIYVK